METFVGGMSYDINDGSSTTSVAWGNGNDNLAFDNNGNLWVMQDGGNYYIWVVGSDHDQNASSPVLLPATAPKVKASLEAGTVNTDVTAFGSS